MLILGLVVAYVLVPADVMAWGGGTHLRIAEIVIQNRGLLTGEISTLLANYPMLFSYGNIIADLILGKRYGIEYRHHSHNWEVAFGMLDRATEPTLRAVLWGYLCHLAADVVAHNVFIPTKVAYAAPGRGRGHAYWEMYYDAHIPTRFVKSALEVERSGRHHADQFLFRELRQTVFSHRNNKRLFNGMLYVQQTRFYRGFAAIQQRVNPFRIERDDVHFYDDLNFRAVADLLLNGTDAEITTLDPTGHAAIENAFQLRKDWRNQRRINGEESLSRPDRISLRTGHLENISHLDEHPFDIKQTLI